MATNTTNFGLKKPAYTDTADIADINGNMDKVDVSLNGLADAIAIVANNNTHAAITAGQFVYVHGHGSLAEGLYTAKSNIAANAALSTSNLQADGSGGLNALNSSLTPLTNRTGVITLNNSNPAVFNISSGGYGGYCFFGMWQGLGSYPIAAIVNNNVLTVKYLISGTDYTGTAVTFSYNSSTHKLTVSQQSSGNSIIYYIS